jgi:hypothetical protein
MDVKSTSRMFILLQLQAQRHYSITIASSETLFYYNCKLRDIILLQLQAQRHYSITMASSETSPPRGRGFRQELQAHWWWFSCFRPVKSKCVFNPLIGNNSRISSSKLSILPMPTFKKLKYKNVFKIKINLTRPCYKEPWNFPNCSFKSWWFKSSHPWSKIRSTS